MFKNIAVIISTKQYSNNLNKTIKSVLHQSYLPQQLIIVSGNKIKKNLFIGQELPIKVIHSKIKNQVYQRNLGINALSNKIEIIIQLDDRVILQKNCIKELINCWNNSAKNITGIGINQISKNNDLGFLNKFSNFLGLTGKVFSIGLNFDYGNINKNCEVMWLKGGLSSWHLKKNLRIKNRKFPNWNWCVNEDVEFSLGKKKYEKLIVCSNAKAKLLDSRKLSNLELYNRGILLTLSKKLIIKKFYNNSLLSYFGIVILITLGIFKSILFFKISNINFNLGRLFGLFK